MAESENNVPSGNTGRSLTGSRTSNKDNYQVSARLRDIESKLAFLERKIYKIEGRFKTIQKITQDRNGKMKILVK